MKEEGVGGVCGKWHQLVTTQRPINENYKNLNNGVTFNLVQAIEEIVTLLAIQFFMVRTHHHRVYYLKASIHSLVVGLFSNRCLLPPLCTQL